MAKCSNFKHQNTNWGGDFWNTGQWEDFTFQVWVKSDFVQNLLKSELYFKSYWNLNFRNSLCHSIIYLNPGHALQRWSVGGIQQLQIFKYADSSLNPGHALKRWSVGDIQVWFTSESKPYIIEIHFISDWSLNILFHLRSNYDSISNLIQVWNWPPCQLFLFSAHHFVYSCCAQLGDPIRQWLPEGPRTSQSPRRRSSAETGAVSGLMVPSIRW